MDLLALYKNPNFNFQKVIRESLRAYVRGVPYFVYVPKCEKDLAHFQFNPSYQFTINLDDRNDADVIAWLNQAQPRLKNALVKSIMRGCMVGASAFACLSSDKERDRANMITEVLQSSNITISLPPTGRHTMRKNNDAMNVLGIAPVTKCWPAKTIDESDAVKKAAYDTNTVQPATRGGLETNGLPSFVEPTAPNTVTAAYTSYAPEQQTSSDLSAAPVTIKTEPNYNTNPNKQSVSSIERNNTVDSEFDFTGFGDDAQDTNVNSERKENEGTDTFDLFGDIANMMNSLQH